MKMLTAFAVTAILGCADLQAAEPPATPSAVPVKRPSLKTCNQRADARKLSGKERSQYVQACQAGKPDGRSAVSALQGG
jgi:psiF repeat